MEKRQMDLSVYILDATAHAVQMIPPMALYFLCVPDEMFRKSRRNTAFSFYAVAAAVILLGSAVKLSVRSRFPQIPYSYLASLFLFAEFMLLASVARLYVRVPVWPNHIIVLLVLFWGSMQYIVSNFILSICGGNGAYDFSTILVFAVFTVILFPVAKRIMVPYAKEYLLLRDAIRSPAQIMVVIMAGLSIVQMFLASWEEDSRGFFTLALMSVCITVTHWILIRYVVMQEQRTRTELHLLASQIRPHFILNTLNAIINLVDEDPQATRQAMYDFSGYLRMNFEALEKETPVWFQEELEHTRFYLSIEKLRFRDELNITIDTPVTEFALPALTVQPMVENAVRHGLRAKEGIGNLVLRTRETETAYEVLIEDDGVGTEDAGDGNRISPDDGKHFGLMNVRARLKQMVDGTLSFESVPGEGTRVTIRIPKNPAGEHGGFYK